MLQGQLRAFERQHKISFYYTEPVSLTDLQDVLGRELPFRCNSQ